MPGDGAPNTPVHNAEKPKVDAVGATARPIFGVRGTATPTILTTVGIMPPTIIPPISPITLVPKIVDNNGHDASGLEHRGKAGLRHRGRAGHLQRNGGARPGRARHRGNGRADQQRNGRAGPGRAHRGKAGHLQRNT